MVTYSEFSFFSSGGYGQIHVNQWVPSDGALRGVIQIVHGASEYGFRYDEFARYLCGCGFAVLANDHLGHGKSAYPSGCPVYFGRKQGWWHVIADMETLHQRIERKFPHLPIILFAHSMGSFLARTHMIMHPGAYSAYILSGTGHPSQVVIRSGKRAAAIRMKKIGPSGVSPFIDQMTFGSFNQNFAPNRTPFDWIAASEKAVDSYIADSLCGRPMTVGLFRDMIEGLSYITQPENIRLMDRNSPIFLIAGEQDPVGNMGKDIFKIRTIFTSVGMQDVCMNLYPGLRHDILHEACHPQVYHDIYSWLSHRSAIFHNST